MSEVRGSRVAVLGGGSYSLMLAAALAAAGSSVSAFGMNDLHRESATVTGRGDTINKGRRAEKDRIAMQKAEEKRARKAAKRMANRP